MHQNSPFSDTNSKKFHPTPLGAFAVEEILKKKNSWQVISKKMPDL